MPSAYVFVVVYADTEHPCLPNLGRLKPYRSLNSSSGRSHFYLSSIAVGQLSYMVIDAGLSIRADSGVTIMLDPEHRPRSEGRTVHMYP
jgi:hypothetical protein